MIVFAIALLLCLPAGYFYWRSRKQPRQLRGLFKHGDILGDIAHSEQLEQVGPVQEDADNKAFTKSLHALIITTNKALDSVKGKTVALISTRESSGVTTLALSMARGMASQGQKTLLLDLNFMRPMVHLATATASRHGISNYLLSDQTTNIVVQDTKTSLDIIGTGNVPIQYLQKFLAAGDYRKSLMALFASYERVVVDCAPVTDANIDVSRIAAMCDLRMLIVDAEYESIQSEIVQFTLQTHSTWPHGTSVLLRNKAKSVVKQSKRNAPNPVKFATENTRVTYSPIKPPPRVPARLAIPVDAPAPTAGKNKGVRPIHSEAWIVRQPDDMYTLKLTELSYRPILTPRQVSIYAGHQAACFKLTILGRVNYILILGQFNSEEEALEEARVLGLQQRSVMPVTFASVKKGIRHELSRKKVEPELSS